MTRALSKVQRGGLSKYDPQKGLKTVAVAEAAEKHFARAKDATKLQQAIRAKLEAQAEFVFWWDTKGPGVNHGGRRSRGEKQNVGSDILLSAKTVSRWRNKLGKSPNTFELAFEQAFGRYVKILEFETSDPELKASLSNEWYTPDRYLDAARAVLGEIDLDPASNPIANKTVRAASFFTIDNSGLEKDWHGRIWLNPPYGGLSGAFAAHLIDQFVAGNVKAAVLLVNSNSTDAGWFQPLWDYLLCFTDHRINFIAQGGGEQSGSTHGSVFVYLGPERDLFLNEFSPFGAVVERAS